MQTIDRISKFQSDVPANFFGGRVKELAWDIETSGLDWKSDRIASCQLSTSNGEVAVVRIDPNKRPSTLCSLLRNVAVRKIFHHAPFDLRFMSAAWSVEAQNIVCTKVASKILVPEEKDHSLKALLHRHLGITLDKSLQTSNWFAESWSEEQVLYAARDVLHLHSLFTTLETELMACDRLGLAQKCFDHLPTRVRLELGGYGDVFAH